MKRPHFHAPTAVLLGLMVVASPATAADILTETDPTPPEPVEALTPAGGWYVGARIGAAFADDSRFGVLGTTVSNQYNTGYNLSAALGYTFDAAGLMSFRAEGELGYKSLEIDSHNVTGLGVFSGGNATGDTSSFYGLANGYVDFNTGALTPFVGAGIGYASLDFDGHGVTSTGTVMNSSGDGLAWQVGAGLAYDLTESLKVDLSYRYMNIEDVDLTATDGTTSSVDFSDHLVSLGIRQAF